MKPRPTKGLAAESPCALPLTSMRCPVRMRAPNGLALTHDRYLVASAKDTPATLMTSLPIAFS